MKYLTRICFLYIFIGIIQCRTPKLPDFVKTCPFNDEIDECLKDSIISIIPYISKGIPEMKIPALDPFEVQKAGYNSDNLNIEFFDMKSYNLTNIETLTTHVDMQERSISLNFSNTNLRTFAKYKTTGKLATIAIEGGGPMDLNCSRSDTYLKFTWDVIQKNGKDYALVTSFQYNVDIGDFQNSLGNLVPGNAELTQAINNAINENGKDTIVAIIRNIFYEIFHNTIKHVLESYPIDILFPKK